jgi:hypothetical protein
MYIPSLITVAILFGGSAASAILPAEYDSTEHFSKRTENIYVACGVNGTRVNHNDTICNTIKTPSSYVTLHHQQADGSWNKTETKILLSDYKKQLDRESEEYKAKIKSGALVERDCAPTAVKYSGFSTNDWGYWYPAWKPVGGCWYANSDGTHYMRGTAAAQNSWSQYCTDSDLQWSLSQVFGFNRGDMSYTSELYSCYWYGTGKCYQMWFQPQYTYHHGTAQFGVSYIPQCYNGYSKTQYVTVDQAPNDYAGGLKGTIGCGSLCSGSCPSDTAYAWWWQNTTP